MAATARCDVLGCECGCHRAKHRQAPRLWTPEMDDSLTSAARRGEHPRVIAARLHLTEDSIRWRARSLGISLRDGWRSRQEVAAALGVSWRRVERWASDGHLRVLRHGPRWRRITDGDLHAFIARYAGLLFELSDVRDPALRRLAEVPSRVNRRALA